jgi:cysteinyl-tRNA synthetase
VSTAVRTVRLHDTRSGVLQVLTPRDGRKVGIYACGPTVYARIHVGNARPFVVFSQLARFLAHEGYEPTLVVNVTDVNDKIYDAALAAGVPSAPLAEEMTAQYVADTDRLGLGRPDAEPRATQTIEAIVALIGLLIDRGAAYAVDGDVYFRVRSDPQYGSLSRRRPDQMEQGEGIEGAGRKEDPLDFALWKAQKEGEDTAWDAPWGRGRPGWHIECSAMAEELLGVGFEIHGGGNDLAFPHHENEAAQTRRAHDAELAQIWMHNGMLQLGEEKMAKSVGNVAALHTVLDRWGAEALLMFFAGGHYRQPIAFDDDAMRAATARVAGIREAARRLADGPSPPDMAVHRDAFFDALADDFNTARALSHLAAWVTEANKREGVGRADLQEMLGVLGLEDLATVEEVVVGDEERELLERRQAARAAKDFAAADRLRDELRARGFEVRDGPAGPELVPVA